MFGCNLSNLFGYNLKIGREFYYKTVMKLVIKL